MTVLQQDEHTRKKAGWFADLSVEFVISFLLLLVAVAVFALAVNIVFIHKDSALDEAAFAFAGKFVSPGFTRFMVGVSFLGKHTFLIPANLLLLGYCFWKKYNYTSTRIAALSLSSLAIKLVVKGLFHRPRPAIPLLEQVPGFSFPSGHALFGITFYGLLIVLAYRKMQHKAAKTIVITLLAILIVLICFSRIYLRVHYISDVMAGIALGFIWLTVSLWFLDRRDRRRFQRAGRKVN